MNQSFISDTGLYMSSKGLAEIAIIISKLNTEFYIQILDNLQIPSIENVWRHFQNDNTCCDCKSRESKFFFNKRIPTQWKDQRTVH